MKEVTRGQFKEIYFRLGGGAESGWSLEYWKQFFEHETESEVKYFAEEPETPEHTRMMIVSDSAKKEHRLFFLTEEGEETLFEVPGER